MPIHDTAIVDPQATIHESSLIGPNCYIEGHVDIGARTVLTNNVSILGNVAIGEDNYIASYAVIGGIAQDRKYNFEQTGVEIGCRNRIFEFATINRGTPSGGGVTVIGDDNFIMSYVHVAHDTSIANGCNIASYTGLAGHVIMGNNVNVGGMVAISQRSRFGDFSFVSGRSIVIGDIPPFSIAYGTLIDTYVRGVNLRGMLRAGFSRPDIRFARGLLNIWTNKSLSVSEAINQIEKASGSERIKGLFLGFFRDASRVRAVLR